METLNKSYSGFFSVNLEYVWSRHIRLRLIQGLDSAVLRV